MQPNKVKARLAAGEAVVGPIIGEMRTIGPVKIMALAGLDFLFLDMEHGMANWETTSSLVQMALVCDICPIVRPTNCEQGNSPSAPWRSCCRHGRQ